MVASDTLSLTMPVARKFVRMYVNADTRDMGPEGREALELLRAGFFARGDRSLFEGLVASLLDRDEFMLLADFASYLECQSRVSAAFRNTKQWTRMSILNTARMGKFSSDRAIREYCKDIWKIKPVRVVMNGDLKK